MRNRENNNHSGENLNQATRSTPDDYSAQQAVIHDIQRQLPRGARVNEAAIAAALEAALQITTALSAGFTSLAGMALLCHLTPGANLVTTLAIWILLGGNLTIYQAAELGLNTLTKAVMTGTAVAAVSAAGLFAGRKLNFFPSDAPQERDARQLQPTR